MRKYVIFLLYFCCAFDIIMLFQVSPGDTGWDVFSLDYHVDGPISTVSVTLPILNLNNNLVLANTNPESIRKH